MNADRVIPRFSRYLRDYLGWTLTTRPLPPSPSTGSGDGSGDGLYADVYYLSGYFEWSFMKAAGLASTGSAGGPPVAAYFTHREEEPPGNGKAKLFDALAGRLDLRLATAAMYAERLAEFGPTAQVWPPVERDRFVIPNGKWQMANGKVVAGFSGYTYGNGRKGEGLAKKLVKAFPASTGSASVEWKASGRGWPVRTRKYSWAEMAGFYQSLDILVVTSMVEGVPMPPLEALACGVSVVIPRGVGLLDELPPSTGSPSTGSPSTGSGNGVLGIHRYKRGDVGDLVRVFGKAVRARPDVDREALRAVTEPYTVLAWCEQHRAVFEEVFC